MPELDVEADVGGDSALNALGEAGGQHPQQHDVDGHLMVVEKDVQVADTQFGAGGRRNGQHHRRRTEVIDKPQATHTANGPLYSGGRG